MNWKWMAGLGLLIVSFIAGWVVNGWRHEKAQAVEKAETVQANADHFRDVTKKVNDEASQLLSKTYELKSQISKQKKELANAQKNNPVTADCKPDADRLRIIRDAVTAANTAAGQ